MTYYEKGSGELNAGVPASRGLSPLPGRGPALADAPSTDSGHHGNIGKLDYVIEFLRAERATKARATLQNHLLGLRKFAAWLEPHLCTGADITPLDLGQYVADLVERYPPDSVNNYISVLRVYFRWLCEVGVRADNPAATLRFRPARHRPVESLTADQVQVLLHYANTLERARFGCQRAAFLVLFLIETGMRLSEALSLTAKDVNLVANQIVVTATKTNSIRVVPLTPIVRRHLLVYLRRRRDFLAGHHRADCKRLLIAETGAPWSVNGAERGVETVGRRAGIARHLHPHLFRHTFAALFCAARGTLPALMQIGGWSKLSTVQVYSTMNAHQLGQALMDASPLAHARDEGWNIPDEEAA
jgi:site-specific recombinase XerD